MAGPVQLQVMLLRERARLPARQSEHASGFDLYACLDSPLEVGTMPVLVPTGVAIAAPPGTDVQIRPRSGLSARGVMGAFGTIDADYRGELFVTLYCLPGLGRYVIEDGERIGQLVISRLAETEWQLVEELGSTTRGASGHGSTGKT